MRVTPKTDEIKPPNPGPGELQETPATAAENEKPAAGENPGPKTEPGSGLPETSLVPLPPARKPPPTDIGVLGTIDVLSEKEEMELNASEAVIALNSQNFVEIGEAFGRIRDLQLYRVYFQTFEAYCRTKWQYERRYVYNLIAAAKVFTHLRANCGEIKPEHESQLRPLAGLPLEKAQAIWDKAVENARGRAITARLVKNAIQELTEPSAPANAPAVARPKKAELRKLIETGIGELLLLLGQKARHEVLTEKVQAIYSHIQGLFVKP